MEAIVQWFSPYGGWGVAALVVLLVFWLVLTGKLVTSAQMEREQQGQRDLANSVDRLADSVDNNTESARSVQDGQRANQEGLRSILHALTEFQKAREEQR